jgi:DNA-binding winged helix-turn-helix (wHTH) protein/Flp pilus assembly protein TadD
VKVRFGAYELDVERGTLRKHGIALKLREQSIRVLIALMERPGELVTREELRQRLWKDGTFVDFETGLNTAISRLRDALNDSAGAARYIETIPKRGYRFIASRLQQNGPGGNANNPEAHTAYLQGHFLVKRHSPANSARALRFFEQAIEADPGYALPYHGAAIVHILDTLLGVLPPLAGMARAESFLNKGLAIEENSAMVQNTLAMLRMFQWRRVESERAYQRAIDLEPSNPHPHMMYALHLSFCGRHEEAWKEARGALELDPVDSMMNLRVVQAAYYARRYDDAIQSSRIAVDLAPEFHPPRSYLAMALMAAGQNEGAWSAAQKARELGCGLPFSEGQFGYIAGKFGDPETARRIIEDLAARRERGYGPALPIAWAWLGLGDFDACGRWLETALHETEPFLVAANVAPIYDALRSTPEFIRLLGRVGEVRAAQTGPDGYGSGRRPDPCCANSAKLIQVILPTQNVVPQSRRATNFCVLQQQFSSRRATCIGTWRAVHAAAHVFLNSP